MTQEILQIFRFGILLITMLLFIDLWIVFLYQGPWSWRHLQKLFFLFLESSFVALIIGTVVCIFVRYLPARENVTLFCALTISFIAWAATKRFHSQAWRMNQPPEMPIRVR